MTLIELLCFLDSYISLHPEAKKYRVVFPDELPLVAVTFDKATQQVILSDSDAEEPLPWKRAAEEDNDA